jgi:hypothetical protein
MALPLVDHGQDDGDAHGHASWFASTKAGILTMSKHSNFVSVSVDPCAKKKLANASKAVAELASAFIVADDDSFGTNPSRRR